MHFDLKSHTILRAIHGSFLYGTNVEGSDKDYKGVAVAPMNIYLGVTKFFEQAEKYENKGADCDETIYDVRKYIKLASDNNPTVLEVLFVPDDCITDITEEGKYLMENASHFLSKKSYHTHSGFAFGQVKKMNTHRRWALNPIDKKPERSEFNLGTQKIKNDDIGAIEWLEATGQKISGPIIELVNKEKAYKRALDDYTNYQNWKENRNKERFANEEKFGYDLKFAVHVIRLHMQCREILAKATCTPRRPKEEREILLAIRKGGFSYEQFTEMADNLSKECESLYSTSTLRHGVDQDKIDEICMNIIERFHKKK